jgi:serine phosphatase RsbU (regulator of sigma subunit)/anti-sigma regulatory factor (Ser/Thr protein kinase)
MTAVDEVDGEGRSHARPWAADVLDHTRHATALLDVDGVVLDCSQRLAHAVGAPRSAVVGAPLDSAAAWRRAPEARRQLRTGIAAAAAGRPGAHDVELPRSPDRSAALLRLNFTPVREGGRVVRIVLDITERSPDRDEHVRLLSAERTAGRRATALQRVAAALSEAATSEQVAAVMVEESVRRLGADAARIELYPVDPPHGGDAPRQGPDVVRTAGVAELLRAPVPRPAGPLVDTVREDDDALAGRVVLPLLHRGRVRGRWALAWRRPEPSAPARGDWAGPDGTDRLRTLAAECTEALERAEQFEHQRDIATVLQRTLLPTVLPSVADAQVAARYHPGGRGVDVGGDWYDVIALPGGRTGLVIGDVEGHSAEAAAVMGQVRGALRAYAVEGSTPAIVMERLNRLLVRLGITRLVSCCYLEFAGREGTATVVLAGHPPPLVLHPDGRADFVAARPNLVLGVEPSASFVETTVLLDPGSCLLLYTDGLVETVSRELPDGLAALRGWAQGQDVEESCDSLVETLIRRAREGLPVADDVAVLALRYLPAERRPPSRLRAVRRRLPLDPASPSAARRFVTDVLDQWDHGALAAPVSLMTSELVTNSVLHTTGELELGLYLDLDRLRVEVVDRSERLPTLQTPDEDATGGRGLLIIEALSQAWGVESRGGGKAVWFEVSI